MEYDVYVSCCDAGGSELAGRIVAGLAARGFRVYPRPAGPPPDAAALDAIEEIPDFVLLLTHGCLDDAAAEAVPFRREIARAVKSGRNIVPVVAPGFVRPDDSTLPDDLAGFDNRGPVPYGTRSEKESIARIAHRLSSDASVAERHMMRQAKWIGSFVGLVLLALIAIAIASVVPKMFARRIDERPLPPLVLRWSGFGEHLENGRWMESAIQDGSRVANGDRIRIVFSASGDGFAYVVSKDLRGEIRVLFPGRAMKGSSRVVAGQLYQAPADGGWFTAEGDAGVETIYVFTSYDPLENVESLLEEHAEEASPDARRALLQSTLEGLLDGRHAGAVGRVRTRAGRPIVERAQQAGATATASVTLDSGATATHRLAAQEGLVSAVSEIRLRYER